MFPNIFSGTISIYIIFQLISSHVRANCPPKSQVRANAVFGGTQFGGRSLNQECCVSGRRQCECNFGLQCCKNHANTRICIESPCGAGCTNGRCVVRNGQSRCVCNQGFVLNRSSVCVRRNNNSNNRGRQKQEQSNSLSGLIGGFFAPRRGNSALGVLLCSSNPCINGECVVVRSQVECRCSRGFVLNQLTQTCDDPNQFTTVPPTSPPSPAVTVSSRTTTPNPSLDPRCAGSVCGVNTVCTIETDIVVCVCAAGFNLSPQGTCFFDHCTTNTCGTNERCNLNSDLSAHECVCDVGFTRNSDNDCVEPVCASTCGTNTNCVIGQGGAPICLCKTGTFLSPSGGCVNSTCDNTCRQSEVCTISNDFATCTCRPGFTADPVSGECLDPCVPNPCSRNKLCKLHVESRTTSCECPEGLTEAIGGSCVADACEPNPCGTGGNCIQLGSNHVCSCSAGFLLIENTCVEDPCEPNPCGDGGRCSLAASSNAATCTCSLGFTLKDNVCIDNPCQPNPCGVGDCTVDASGQSSCECPDNFVLRDGGSCVPALSNPCIPNPCGVGGACISLSSGASCQCNPGFALNSAGTCSVATTTQAPAVTTKNSEGSGSATPAPVSCPAGASCGVGTCILVNGQHACNCPEGFSFRNSTCTFSAPCDPQTTSSTLELGDSGNQKIPRGSTTGCLKSRNYPSASYDANLFDEVELNVQEHTTLHIIIENLETQPEETEPVLKVNTCLADFIFVKGQLFCGFISASHKPALRILNVSDLDTIAIGFVSDSQAEFKGFLLRWILI